MKSVDFSNSIHYTNIGTDWCEDVEGLCNKLILQHKWSKKNYSQGQYVFDIAPNNIRYFQPLFDIVVSKVRELYPAAIIPEKFASSCWAYVSNQERSVSVLHNHIPEKVSKDLSTVFYIKKPKDSGDILFLIDGKKHIHRPVEGELLVFPATYYHSPLPSNTKDYRIAININVITHNKYNCFLTMGV